MKKIVYIVLSLLASNIFLSGCHSSKESLVLTKDSLSGTHSEQELLVLQKYKPEQKVRVTANNCDTIVPAFIARGIQKLLFQKYYAEGNQGAFHSYIDGNDHYSSASYWGTSNDNEIDNPSHGSHASHASHSSHSSHYSSY